MTTSPPSDIQPDYVTVPREPTEAMLRAAVRLDGPSLSFGEDPEDVAAVWSAMLSAAPAPPIPTSVANEGGVLAYRYVRPNTLHPSKPDHVVVAPAHERWKNSDGWTETPLYAALSPALDNTAVEVERLREALAAEDDYWAASRAHASALPRLREATGAVFAAATARRDAARAALTLQTEDAR